MSGKIGIDKRSAVHKESSGSVHFMPDVCKTPTSGGPVPIPYPNVALSQDAAGGATTVFVEGNPILVQGSVFSKSTGDEAGSLGGVASGVTKGAAEFIGCSFDVFAEGKGVARLGDLMLGNKGGVPNTPPMREIQAPFSAQGKSADTKLEPDSIEVIVTDKADKPLADIRYVLEMPDGSKVEGKTDSSGKIEVEETIWGLGRIVFPDLDTTHHLEPND